MSFNFSEYINSIRISDEATDDLDAFYKLCSEIKEDFFKEWKAGSDSLSILEIQKRAIVGYEKERSYYLERIAGFIEEKGALNCAFPKWYKSLADAIYHENWGLAGIAEWFSSEYAESSSAKIIGSRIYFMEKGRMVLKEQSLSKERKQQLIKAFLLLTPEKRMDRDYYEVYLLDGTRVTIYTEPMAKEGQSSIVFRRYFIPSLSFEEQARRGTIPFDAIPMLKSMVGIGYNVVFMGAVRTAKTTFLSTWQSYEDPSLEGVLVETDPEIPIHEILPNAPIIQLIADGEELKKISKNLLRSDADYFIMAEARDGLALDTALKLACKGTKRMKLTFHSRNPKQFPLEAATEIVKSTGGDLPLTMKMISSSFDYLFHFIQLSDKSQKRLNAIYQMSLDETGTFHIDNICKYIKESESWIFQNKISDDKRDYGMESNPEEFRMFEEQLKMLTEMESVK